MINYTYLDFMRHMQPYDLSNDITFSVFGTFDALHVEASKDIESMKSSHEERHGNIPWQSERQPMFLASIKEKSDVFDPENYASFPLILCVIQVEKTALKEIDLQKLLEQMDKQLSASLSEGAFGQCFFNLGQADFVIAIRTPLLFMATNAILEFWKNGIVIGNRTIRILSSSSHCAFPIQKKGETLKNNLKTWLETEARNKTNLSFEVYYSFSGDSCEITNESDQILVLGDSDLQKKPLGLSDWESTAQTIYDILSYHSLNDNITQRYLASVTLPLLSYEAFCPLPMGEPDVRSQRLKMDKTWEANNNQLQQAFSELADCFSLKTGWSDQPQIKKTIKSMSITILGLHKYLFRLGKACFEYDLEKYTEPVFRQITLVANQLVTLMKDPDERDKDDIRYLVREFIDHTAHLITELQHLYSVLALSPSTFMETYGSSMRSLNATAKLLSAYQGTLIYLNKRLPSKLIINNELESSNHAVLMIPYRMTQSSNIIMYPSFSPKERLSLIHIDFTKMFNAKQVLFMLLHEAGHMLGDHNRTGRFFLFVKAVLKQYLEQYVLSERFSLPGFVFFSIDGEETILPGMCQNQWNALFGQIDSSLSNGLNEYICEQVNLDADEFKTKYENEKGPLWGLIQKQSYFLDLIIPILYDYISDIYAQIPNNENLRRLAEYLTNIYIENAQNAFEFSQNITCNHRFFSKVKAYYNVPYRKSFIYSSLVRNSSENLENLMHRIEAVFQDIQADVFMCKLLDIEPEEYSDMLRTFSGHNVSVEFVDPCNLIRFDLIYQVCFQTSLDKKALTTNFGFLNDKAEEIISLLEKRRKSNTYIEFQKYAKICCETVATSVNSIEKDPAFQAIRTLFHKEANSCEFINAVLCMFSNVFQEMSEESC